jgi:ubiquinone biosynthesis protein
VELLDEFAEMLRAETDYGIEAENMNAVRRAFAGDPVVSIPTVIAELSSASVLVMDWMDGIPLSKPEELDAIETNRPALARAVAHSYAHDVRADPVHADPHPGNLIALTDERLGLVDFGELDT